MKRTFFILVILTLVSSLGLADDLKRLNLDDAAFIGTTIQTDSRVKIEGKGSVRITTKHPTTVCLGEVSDLDIENAKLIYKAKVKTELDGVAFLEMWAHVSGALLQQCAARGTHHVWTCRQSQTQLHAARVAAAPGGHAQPTSPVACSWCT